MFYSDGTAKAVLTAGGTFDGHYKVRLGNYSLKKDASREVWYEHEVWWRTP